jgi:soluble lytic murein transglycosylase-like protein
VADADRTAGVGRAAPQPLGALLFDRVLVPALIAGDEARAAVRPAVEAIPPAVRTTLRSRRARAAIGLPLLWVALEATSPGAAEREARPAARQQFVPRQYGELITRAARRSALDPALVAAVIEQESRFEPEAHNASSGASGLMQLAPATSAAFGVTDPTDPRQSITAGCRYLRQLLIRFGGDVRLALAAYNAGPTAVDRAGGVPDFSETRAYVKGVLRRWAANRRSAA